MIFPPSSRQRGVSGNVTPGFQMIVVVPFEINLVTLMSVQLETKTQLDIDKEPPD